jgi:hypothetical protein
MKERGDDVKANRKIQSIVPSSYNKFRISRRRLTTSKKYHHTEIPSKRTFGCMELAQTGVTHLATNIFLSTTRTITKNLYQKFSKKTVSVSEKTFLLKA